MFDPNRRADVFLTVESAPDKAPRTVSQPSTVASPPRTAPRAENFYEQQVKLMRRSGTDVISEGRRLRLDANQLLVWCRNMGEGTGAASWGARQQDYAADARLKLRARADKLKADIQSEGRDLEKTLNSVFDPKFRTYPYTEEVERQARAELGI